MVEITIDDVQLQLPSNWKEATPEQLLTLCALHLMVKSPFDLLTQWLHFITGLKPLKREPVIRRDDNEESGFTKSYWYKLGKKEVLINEAAIAALVRQLDWVFEVTEVDENDENTPLVFRFNPKVYDNPIPAYDGLIGPAGGLNNCIYGEYADAENHFFKFTETRSADDLTNLIATLWRPKVDGLTVSSVDYKGDLRIPFNPFYTEQIAKQVAKWPEHIRQCALLFYLGCRYNLSQEFDLVFEAGEKDEEGEQGTGETGETMDIVRFHLAITHLLANKSVNERETVRAQYLYDVLDTLQKMREEAALMQQQNPANGTTEF